MKQDDSAESPRWLLLIHQLPPRPAYLRVKVGRRLQRLGSVAIKNSVYALPAGEQAREDLQWVAREVAAGGGEASVVEARFLDGLSDREVAGLFHAAREADYRAIGAEARALRGRLRRTREPGAVPALLAEVGRLRRRLGEVAQIDHLGAPGREAAEALVAELEERVTPPGRAASTAAAPAGRDRARARTWVTRQGIKVDRIGSAWLIRGFIDPEARFRFVPGQGYRPEPGELRFDMFEAEYTHQGDRCTFEVLLERFGLADPGLRRLGEVVHDLDLKDGKYARPETAGLERLLAGLFLLTDDDEQRLRQGGTLFETLHRSYQQEPP